MSNLAQRLAQAAQFDRNPTEPQVMPFGEWAPDQPDYSRGTALVARNVLPGEISYLPVPSPVEQSPAVNGRVYHAVSGKDNAGNSFSYAATADKLYQVRSDAVTDKSSMAYTTPDTGMWDAAQFGEWIIFTNYVNPVQAIKAGDAGNFIDAFTSTSKPQARVCDTLRNFLVLGNVNDEDGPNSNRIRWSAINNFQDMDPDSATQSDFEDISSGGAVQRIVGGGDYGVIAQEKQITRMSYTGDASVFRFDPIDRNRGTPIPKSVVGHGRSVYFISEEGFFRFTGTESIPIGEDKVDRTFWNEFDVNNVHRMSSTVSFQNKLVGWLYPGEGSTGGNPNKIIAYNWAQNKWSEIYVDLEALTQALTQGYTLEELDSVSTSIDDLPYSLDDPIWQGGAFRLGAYTRNNKLAYFVGPNLEAYLDTNDFQLFGGRRALVDFVRPLVDGATSFLRMSARDRLADSLASTPTSSINSVTSEVAENDDGVFPVDISGRYQRALVRVAAGERWTHAQGVEVYGSPDGEF